MSQYNEFYKNFINRKVWEDMQDTIGLLDMI